MWLGDHLFFRKPHVECVTALALIAGATSRIRLSPGVLLPALRNPVLLAKQLTTLAVMSGERLEVGVGVGGEYPPEWTALGVDRSQRGALVDDFLDVLAAFQSGEPVRLTGRRVSVDAPAMEPLPATPIPLWIGGRSDAALARAERADAGWLALWASSNRLAAVAQEHPSRPIGVVLYVDVSKLVPGVDVGTAEAYIRRSYNLGLSDVERWIVSGSRAQFLDQLVGYAAVADQLVLHPMVADASVAIDPLGEIINECRAILANDASQQLRRLRLRRS